MKIDKNFSLQKLSPEAKADKQDKQLREAAKMYEHHFLGEMVKAMRSTVQHEDGFLKPNFAEKIFSEQLDQQYVEGWADKGGVGLADMIYTQIKDKYMGGGAGADGMMHLKGGLPVGPKKETQGLKPPEDIKMKALPPSAANTLNYRFQGGEDVLSPMAGKILSLTPIGQGWTSINLDHGDGLRSELTFPGQIASLSEGDRVGPGQRLGTLDPATPTLAWNLDWS